MATNIFNRKIDFGGTFTMDSAIVRFGGVASDGNGPNNDDSMNSTGMIVSNISIQYAQPVNTLWTLTGSKGYLVIGRPDGTATLQGVVADKSSMSTFLQKYGDGCKADNVISISSTMGSCAGAPEGAGMDFKISNAVIQSLGFSVTVENLMMISQTSLKFLNLEI